MDPLWANEWQQVEDTLEDVLARYVARQRQEPTRPEVLLWLEEEVK